MSNNQFPRKGQEAGTSSSGSGIEREGAVDAGYTDGDEIRRLNRRVAYLESALNQAYNFMYLSEVIGPNRDRSIWRAPGIHGVALRVRQDKYPELSAYLKSIPTPSEELAFLREQQKESAAEATDNTIPKGTPKWTARTEGEEVKR